MPQMVGGVVEETAMVEEDPRVLTNVSWSSEAVRVKRKGVSVIWENEISGRSNLCSSLRSGDQKKRLSNKVELEI